MIQRKDGRPSTTRPDHRDEARVGRMIDVETRRTRAANQLVEAAIGHVEDVGLEPESLGGGVDPPTHPFTVGRSRSLSGDRNAPGTARVAAPLHERFERLAGAIERPGVGSDPAHGASVGGGGARPGPACS